MAHPSEMREAVLKDRAAGLSYRELAKRHGVALQTVFAWCRGAGTRTASLKVEEYTPGKFVALVEIEEADEETLRLGVYRALTKRGFEVTE